MTTAPAPAKTTPPAPRPVTPRPLWERHQMFQEPVYVDGQPYEGADSEDDDQDRVDPEPRA